jgi:hypothetical protein
VVDSRGNVIDIVEETVVDIEGSKTIKGKDQAY